MFFQYEIYFASRSFQASAHSRVREKERYDAALNCKIKKNFCS